ncbi:tubulin-specific chaperone a [Moniliophthora roreri MCA 2997]|uniref:Tubulin-specific chaperone A n=1 Tax=Moniliophthora roreri (strain MCA 2997) TaxID=1381753 RepID=V2YZM9_MONRO|nr:tubulin-specific chaperone a [Moniliophthora roreri MCA 2997]
MSDANTLKRQLKIKSGAAKRLLKENGLYRKEAQDLLARREKLIADGVNTDEWEVKNATNMYEESNKMIRDSSDRLLSVIAELKELVNAAHKEAEFAEDVELKNAESILREASS